MIKLLNYYHYNDLLFCVFFRIADDIGRDRTDPNGRVDQSQGQLR